MKVSMILIILKEGQGIIERKYICRISPTVPTTLTPTLKNTSIKNVKNWLPITKERIKVDS